jgi:predicted nicotinamide N-methyase
VSRAIAIADVDAMLREQFDVITERVTLAGRELEILKPRTADALLSEEDFDLHGRIPYWAEIWPASLVLAEHVLSVCDSRGGMPEGRVLELGCGLGIVSAAALMGGWQVVATDYYPEAVQFAELNAARNGLPPLVGRTVDWRSYPPDLVNFDFVIASDVLYERAAADLVAAAIRASLAPHGVAYVTDPQRLNAIRLLDACAEHRLSIDCQVVEHRAKDRVQPIDLFTIRHADRDAAGS